MPRLFPDLHEPRLAVAHIGPNWFASVMGTGIVANAAALLPHQTPALHAFAVGVWIAAAALLAILILATAAHWLRHPDNARGHHADATMAPFYGAPPMALMTVGAGALLVGGDVIGAHAALTVDAVLWTLGTVGGLLTAAVIPYLMLTRHELKLADASATWLMPVVPPMVSAATGAGLLAHVPAGQTREDLLLACYAMFGISLLFTLLVLPMVWARLALHGPGPARTVPTLWIVLGPLGQSVTAAGLLAKNDHGVLGVPYDHALQALAVLYGAPVWGFAMVWIAIATAVTIRTVRRGLPFSLTWWSFTFPVGTCVTGTSQLAAHTGSAALSWVAVGLYALLVTAWLTAATHTLRGTLAGHLLLAPGATPARA